MRQAQALAVMLAGNSVFLTGPPGAGKTYVVNEFIRRATTKGRTVAVTASTGIAATHIGGTTIHSWSGLGIRDSLSRHDEQWLLANARLNKRYNATDVLVIDEISMLHGARLDMVNRACKLLRGNDQPFGGLQVILVGDLFQLPPVSRGEELVDFAHTSDAWTELAPKICYISEQHRQAGDGLLDVLQAMRSGEITEEHQAILSSRLGQKPNLGAPVTRLYAHNVDVETINDRYLAALDTPSEAFTMETRGSAVKVEQLVRSVLAPEILELKIGAEVMFVANNFPKGFVNGTRGQVVDFQQDVPMVKLASTGRIIKVEPHSWTLQEDGKTRAEVTQLPLRLAWAITIHKSQGMSLDAAEMDLSKSFTPGMGYVALSRVRDLKGVYLAGLNRMAMTLHPAIFQYDNELLRASAALAATVPDEPEPEEIADVLPPEMDDALLTRLKAWRLSTATANSLPPYVIAHNTLLEAVARTRPRTPEQLLALPGAGPKKLEQYGTDILQIVAEHHPEISKPDDEATKADKTSTNINREALTAQYPRAFQRWQPAEDAKLLELFEANIYLPEVCEALQRQPAGVWARLAHLLNPGSDE